MSPSDATLSRLLAAEAQGQLDDDEGRELQALLEERLRGLDPTPPPPWDRVWAHLQAQRGRQRRVATLAGSGVAAALAAMVTLALQGVSSPVVVFGGLGLAVLCFAIVGVEALRRAADVAALRADVRAPLFRAMRDDLDRQIRTLRQGAPILLVLTLSALLALSVTVGLAAPKGAAVGTVCVVVMAMLVREWLVTLPRLIQQRRSLD